jgi:hypothetical protein
MEIREEEKKKEGQCVEEIFGGASNALEASKTERARPIPRYVDIKIFSTQWTVVLPCSFYRAREVAGLKCEGVALARGSLDYEARDAQRAGKEAIKQRTWI